MLAERTRVSAPRAPEPELLLEPLQEVRPAAGRGFRGAATVAAVALTGLAAGVALALLWPRPLAEPERAPLSAVAPPSTRPATPESTPTPARTEALSWLPFGKGDARLAIDLEHGLKRGTLRVWVDGDLLLEESLDSRVTKKALVLKSRKGSFEETLEVSPGKHEIKVQVEGDGKTRTRHVWAHFEPGQTRRLKARVGGLVRKDLSLDWD
jgi:hypothetical protein